MLPGYISQNFWFHFWILFLHHAPHPMNQIPSPIASYLYFLALLLLLSLFLESRSHINRQCGRCIVAVSRCCYGSFYVYVCWVGDTYSQVLRCQSRLPRSDHWQAVLKNMLAWSWPKGHEALSAERKGWALPRKCFSMCQILCRQ